MSTFDFDNLVGRDKVALIYVAYYGRLPDPEGFDFWNNFFGVQTVNGFSSEEAALQITDLFVDQDETRSNYPFFENPSIASVEDVGLFLDEVYQNLFNRPPDDAGKAFWSQQIVNRLEASEGFSDILTQIIEGAQEGDIPAIDNKLEVANYYVQNIGDGFTIEQATNLAQSITGDDNTVQQAFVEIDSQTILNNIMGDDVPLGISVSFSETSISLTDENTAPTLTTPPSPNEVGLVGTLLQTGNQTEDAI